jgi:hypothetical protein
MNISIAISRLFTLYHLPPTLASDYLAAPIANRLFFGGEHTSLELRFGYADAAYLSGQREAARILGYVCLLCPHMRSCADETALYRKHHFQYQN